MTDKALGGSPPGGDLDAGRPHRSNDSAFGGLDDAPPRSMLTSSVPPGVARDSSHHADLDAVRQAPVTRLLDFSVRVVSQPAELQRVQALRAAAYGHHLPGLAEAFGRPDPMDRQPDTLVLYAEDKRTGVVIGSCRIQVNLLRPLQIEESVALPTHWRGRVLSEITRLTVLPGHSHQPVRLALVKACHLYCVARQIGGVLAGSRRSLLRQYRSLGFVDVFDDGRLFPLRHGGNLEHRILFRDTVTAEADARAIQHPDYRFVFRDHHPDIRIFEALDGLVDIGLRRTDSLPITQPRAA
jgi:hypothetical protein